MTASQETATETAQRLDLWFYYARLAKSRALCTQFVGSGKIRLNGQRVTKAHAKVRPGDMLVFPAPHGRPGEKEIRVWRIEKLGTRRGPASEAGTLYEALEESATKEEKEESETKNGTKNDNTAKK